MASRSSEHGGRRRLRLGHIWEAGLCALVAGCSQGQQPASAPRLACGTSSVALAPDELARLLAEADRFLASTTGVSKSYVDDTMMQRERGAHLVLATAHRVRFRQAWMRVDFEAEIDALKLVWQAPAEARTFLRRADGSMMLVTGGEAAPFAAALARAGCVQR